MIRRNKRILSLTLSMAVFTTMFMSTSFITKAETVSLGANSEITSNASTESAVVATNIALNKSAISSSVTGGNTASLAVDGNAGTRWESAQGSDPQWISIDLGGSYNISGVKLNWETAAAKDYKIQVSTDNKNWVDAYTKTGGTGGVENITFNSTATGRYIRMLGTTRTTQYGYSLWEFEVYGTPDGNTVNNVDLGPNVKIFDPSMPSSDIQNTVDSVFSKMEANQFGNERYAFLFKPGSYNVNVNVGFFTSVLGLGKTPDAVNITGAVRCEADWMGGNATCNFWRSVENVAVTPTYSSNNLAPAGTLTWAVSQAAPMRRVHIKGGLSLWDPLGTNYDGAWSSGGFIADSKIDNSITSGSQQQFFTRNSQMGSWNGANWNMVFVGNNGAPTDDNAYPSTPDTVVSQTPAIREKPFLYIDDSGNYQVFVPDLRKNSQGITWANGLGQGTSLPIDQFYIAKPDTSTAESINAALSQGKNIIFTPGVYHLSDAINVTKSNTVILGLGLATLIPDNGTAAMNISDVDGVKVSGILFDAGAKNSPVLLKVGQDGSSADHSANPTSLSDLFFRIGGAAVGNADTSLKINSNNVIGDDFWVWRADHGTGVGWTVNNAKNGVIVNGNNVTLYGLFVEHFKEYQTIWNGNGGKVYFYQSELPYDVPNQASWMSNNGTQNGYASYKVADSVTSHQLFGSGIYSYFRDSVVSENNGIEVPNASGVKVHHACSVYLSGNGEITHVVNNTGNTAKSGDMKQSVTDYPNS
ncbi:discoidin domain-containing protein [Clostridium beijerinckii]|uniref:discoidin domain-containing protein n=1 Tax=Clostridium beijerinckii TaxID=1520 RepID=UPI000809DFCC|nr:discoidin domain-containing protein [Clostridium beijerinckii]OCA99127.1 sialidase [Clostridium beijerinckii]